MPKVPKASQPTLFKLPAPSEQTEDDPFREPTRESQPVLQVPSLALPSLQVIVGEPLGEIRILEREAMLVGRDEACDLPFGDSHVSRRHALIRREGERFDIEDLGSRNGLWVNGERVPPHTRRALATGDKIQLGAQLVLRFTWQDEDDARLQRRLLDSALIDPVTACYNKRYFEARLTSELAFARRSRTAFSLVLFDIDHFKQVNDGHGHLVGDQVLAHVGRIAGETLRKEDLLARFGGEEFAVLSRGIPLEGAAMMAERVRRAIEETPFDDGSARIGVTISLGVAELDPALLPAERFGDWPEGVAPPLATLIDRADRALYQAKHEGRNRVVVAR